VNFRTISHATATEVPMQSENRFFDDLAKVANGALGGLANLGSELENRVRDQVERMLARMDVVRREEFDAVAAMAAKARAEQEALEARVAALEAELAARKNAAQPGGDTSPTIG
jgi:BMFP domain-containing protein YqiC